MSRLKRQLKSKLQAPIDENLNFDVNKLEPNTKRVRNIKRLIGKSALILTGVFFLCLASLPIIAMIDFESKYRSYRKSYSQSELKVLESSTFKKLNNIDYPNGKVNVNKVSDEFYNSVINFSNMIENNVDKNINISYSPLGLYMNLSAVSLASDDEETLKQLDKLLGMTKSSRSIDFYKMYLTDYFFNEDGSLQFYNASFQTDKYDYNPHYIADLTNHKIEAFQLDFENDEDISKMLNWINDKSQSQNLFTKRDLNLEDDSILYFFTTMYFKSSWKNIFKSDHTVQKDFYLSSNERVKTSFMNHEYFGECYDNGDYISLFDYYKNGIKIKYLVPNDINKNIYDLVKGKNIFVEDSEKRILSSKGGNLVVNLEVPKIDYEASIDFTDVLKNIGLANLFDKDNNCFSYAFQNNDTATLETSYLKEIKQKSKISFDEDGTTIKNITISSVDGNSSTKYEFHDTIDIKLNQSFIYIIYDANDLPIFVGHMDNPTLKK